MITRYRHNICITQATADTVAQIAEAEARSFSATAELLLKRGIEAYQRDQARQARPAMDEVRA